MSSTLETITQLATIAASVASVILYINKENNKIREEFRNELKGMRSIRECALIEAGSNERLKSIIKAELEGAVRNFIDEYRYEKPIFWGRSRELSEEENRKLSSPEICIERD